MPQDPKTSRNAASGNRKPPGGKRRSDAEIEAFVSEIEALLDYGVGRSQILKQFPQLPSRTVDEYMRQANDRIAEEHAEQRAKRRERALRRAYARLRQLIQDRDAFLGGDQARKIEANPRLVPAIEHAISRVEIHIAKLEGTFAPEQLEIIKRQGWEDLSDAQLETVRKTGRLPGGVTAEDLERRN